MESMNVRCKHIFSLYVLGLSLLGLSWSGRVCAEDSTSDLSEPDTDPLNWDPIEFKETAGPAPEFKSTPAVSTVRMSQRDTAKYSNPQFIQTRDLSDVLIDKIKLLATTLRDRQGGTNKGLVDIANETTEMTHSQHMNRLAIPHYERGEATRVNGDKLRLFLSHHTRKSGEVKFKEAFPIVERIKQGLTYKLSLTGNTTPLSTKEAVPEIRYGLIVQDIEPVQAPLLASLDRIDDSYDDYARPARVVYTIDRVGTDTSSQRVFRDFSSDLVPVPETRRNLPKFFKRPSTDIDLKVEASNSEESVSEKVGSGALPGGKFTFTQADGFLSLQVLTNARLGKESMNYETRLPIYGEASISRKYDEKFKTTQTALNNILVTPDAPQVNLYHLVTENRYRGELFFRRPNLDIGVALDPRVGWAPGEKSGKVGDRVTMSLYHAF